MPRARKYPEELLERGVRLALESGRPVVHVAKDLGVSSEVLRKRVRQAEADGGLRPDLPSTEEREEIRKLRKENFELRRANEILKAASAARARPWRHDARVPSRRPRAAQARVGWPEVARYVVATPLVLTASDTHRRRSRRRSGMGELATLWGRAGG